MKYFLHDTNAMDDEKLTELRMTYGYEGYGLFFGILEKIALQEKPIKTAVLKRQLGVGKKLQKVWSFLEEIELISSKNGETFNENLLKFSEKYQIKKEKNREKVSQWREKQTVKENVTGYEPVRNRSKVKESKVNNNTHDANASEADDSFDRFWDLYDNKRGSKAKTLKKWNSLSPEERQQVFDFIPHWLKERPDPQFRGYPLSFLNGENWKNPIESSRPAQKQMVY